MARGALACVLALAACGGSGAASDPGTGPDVAGDVGDPGGPGDPGPGDPGPTDLRDGLADLATDGSTDLAADGSTDLATDGATDLPPDVPADVEPDAMPTDENGDPGLPPADLPGDVPVSDVTDPGPDTLPTTVVATPLAPEDVVASYLISASPAAWNLFGGADLPLGRHWDEGHVGYHAAIRFPGLAVPAGAVIESAVLAWFPTNEIDSSNILWLQVSAERVPDSPPLSLTDYDAGRPDQRLHTDATIAEWAIRCNDACTDLTEYDCPQRKKDCWDRTVAYACPKDLKALVQEVVGLDGWQPGNALTIFLDPNVPQDYVDRDVSSRGITGVDPERGDAFRPTLTVRYR